MKNFYCVVRGFHQGIFKNEEDTKKEVKNYYDGKYKGFDTKYEAEQFLKYYNENDCRKIYVVKRGYIPGIYMNAPPLNLVSLSLKWGFLAHRNI